MSNVLSKTKQQQVIALGRLGWAVRRIETETGVRRETVSKYLKSAGIPVRPPRGRRLPKAASREGVITDPGPKPASREEVITDPDPPPARSPSASACEPYREIIEAAVERGRNAMAIWQELVDRHGFESKYASVMRFVRKLRGERGRDAHPVIVTGPGEESQVDYGDGPMVRDPQTGKYRRTRLFVMTLGCSRKAARLLVFKSSAEVWARLHERAFRRLGGATRTVVLDNLKEGVLKPDVYDPELNPLYRDVLAHYGVVALPCRVRHPDRKGKVESAIGRAVILQGHRVFYREAHALLEELAEATLDGTRRERMEELGAIPLLIVDDLGMRKLPHTAAEDLLELIMRRYERASTLITSNRPVEDWGKLLGDTAAVSAMLDRVLHHGHVLKCGPRSWRMRNAGLKREDGTK